MFIKKKLLKPMLKSFVFYKSQDNKYLKKPKIINIGNNFQS